MTPPSKLRTLLVLGRVSNVPTVWSNCLAGWLLGGGGELSRFALLCAGATLLYIGGMYLNDAFDVEFDRQHRHERPVPSGAIAEKTVWQLGFLLLAGGLALLVPLGWKTAVVAILLSCSIVVYDAVHKLVTFSPVLMALCRFLLYVLAASVAVTDLQRQPRADPGLAAWSGIALALYIVGVSCLARQEATGTVVQRWPQALLAAPVLLAFLVNDGPFRKNAWLLAAILVLWCARTLRSVWSKPGNVSYAVSGLLAGIVWVDLLAVPDQPRLVGGVFVALFLLALGFQRVVPAT